MNSLDCDVIQGNRASNIETLTIFASAMMRALENEKKEHPDIPDFKLRIGLEHFFLTLNEIFSTFLINA